MSRTCDLIDQIKQITIEIRDIKERKKNKVDSSKVQNTINVRNRTLSGPLQEGHEEHDEDDVHYTNSIQIVLLPLGNRSNQTHCAPTQSLLEEGSTASPSPPPLNHPSSLSSGSPSKPTSKIPPWSNEPDNPESPGNEGDNAGGVVGLPWTTTKGTPSGGDESAAVPDDDDRKAGV